MTSMRSRTVGTSDGVDWEAYAACRDYDPEMWSVFGQKITADNEQAIAICTTVCPVLTDCQERYRDVPFDGMIVAGVVRRQPIRLHAPARAHGKQRG